MATFNLTAQLNLKGPTNVKQIASQIKKDLGSLNANVQFKLDPAATKNVAALSASLKTLNANFAATVKSAGAATSAIKSFGNSINSIKINSVPQQINQTSTAISKLNKVSAGSARGLQSASTEMQEFGKQAGLAVRRFVAFSTVTSVIYGVTNAINNGVQAFIDYDRELVKLQQVTGESAAGLSKLQSQITNLATEFGVSSKELTQVASTLAQAGLSARETEKALKALALSSLAPSFDNMNETVEGSIALMRQFGISADQLEGSLGAVNTVAAKFAVESSDIITAIQRTGSVFATASKGVSEGKDALNEFIAVFTSIRATSRESAETIATGLRTIFTRIQRGTTIDALKEFGVNLTDAEGKFVGAYKAVELLSKGLSKIDPRSLDFSRIVEELGGFRQIGKVIPLIQQFGVAQQALKVAQQGQGSLAKDAATAQLSLANQIAKVREEFFALFREIGQSKGFQSLIRGTLSLTSGLIKVADAVKGILPALAVIAAFKGFKALTEFTTGFATGVKRGPDGKSGGGIIRKFARGGVVPGSGNGDTVPAMLEPGEFVIRKKAVQAIGTDKLHNMNRYAKGGKIKKYFKGGIAKSSIGSLANESPSVKSYLGNGIDTTDDATTNIISVPIDLDDSDFRQMRDIMVDTERQRLSYMKKYSNESNDRLVRSRAKGPRDPRSVKGFLGMKKPLSQWGAGNAFQQLLIKKYGLKAPASNLGSPDETFQDIIDEHYAVLDYESGDAKFKKNPDYFDSPSGKKEILNKRFKYEYSNNRLKPKPSPKYDDFQLPSTSVYYAKEGLKEKFLKEYPWTVAQQAKAEFPGGAYNFGGKINKFKNGGFIQKFMAGSAVEKLPTTAANIIKALGGALPASNIAGVGTYEIRDLLVKKNLNPKQQEARKKLLKAYGDLGIEQANAEEAAIKKATKFNIVGLFGSTKVGTDANGKEIFEPKWDYSYNMGPQDIGGRSTYIMARGLKSQYASIVYDMQKEQQALDAKFAKNLQMQSIFGSQGPLVFDFDETLVASDPTPMLNAAKTGIDYAKFDNLQLVRDSLKTARLTDLGEELKSRLSDTPELLNEIRVLTARPQSNARPLAETLQRLGLNIPESKITGVSGPENKFANLSELETLIDDRVETIKSIRKKGRKGVAYGELISSDSNPAIKAGTAQVEGAIIEKALAALGAPLIENADPQRPIDYPQGIGAQAAQFFGVDDPSLPTEVKRTLDGNAFERARKEIARFYNENTQEFAVGGPVKPVLAKILDNKKLEWETQKLAKGGKVSEEYSKILASILPSSMLTSDNMLKMPSGEAEPIEFVAPDLKKQSRNKMMAILLGKKEEKEPGSSFYKGGLSFKALRYRLEQSKDKLQKPEYDALKTFIDQNLLFEGNDDIISIMNSRHKGVLPHETFHDIQGHLYDNYPEIMDKLLAGVESQKEAITQWYNDPKNKEWAGPKNYRLEHFFPTADTKNAYSADIITAAHASVKKKTKQDPSMELYSVLGKGLQDLGRNEAIPVLLSAAAVNNKGATEILSKIFGGAGLNPDFYKTLPKYATGGSVEDTVPALLTPGEFVINKKAAQQIGYGQLEKLNKADKIKGFNKGGSVGVFQRFASGGGVDDPLLMLQRFTKYLASNGQISNRPSQINTNTIAVDSSIIDETKAFVQSLYDAGDAMKYLTQLLEQNKQLSIKATLEAGEKDIERLKISGASIDKIVAAERALSSIREKGMQDVTKRQFLEAGFKESTVGKKLGSGATQQKILSLAEKEERRLLDKRRQSIESDIIASSKTPISKSDLADQVNQILSSELEDIKSKAFSRATSAATGTSTSTGIKGSITATELKNLNISGSDIQKYISDSMRDRKTLRQMDQQLIALRMEEYKNAGTVRGISVTSAEEAKKLAKEEVSKRREAINDLAKMRGEKGVGAAGFMDVRNSPIAKAFRERYFTGDLGKSMQRGLGDIGMVSGLVAGQGRNIGSALFDNNTDQGKIKAADAGARIEKAATTLSIGLTTSAQLATINPMLGAAAAIGTALYAGADAVLDFSGTAKQAAQEMEKSLLNDKLQTAADILSESFRKLSADVNNVNLRSKVASNITTYQELALKSTKLETQQQQTQTETRNWTQWAQGGGPLQSLADMMGGRNSWIARNSTFGIGSMDQNINKGAYGVDKIRAEAIKEIDTYRAVSNEAYQDLSRLYSAGFSNAQIMDPSDARGKIVRSSIESMALSDVDRLTSYKTALATDPTGASAQKLLDQFTKDFLDKDELAKASQEAAKLARAMELADKAGRRLAASFDKISDVINESINRISFESDARMESANQAMSALRGESTVSGPKLRERNILENPNAYSEAEFTKALETATQGLDAGTRKQLIGGAQLQQNIPKNIAQSIAGVLNNSRSAGVDEAKKAAIDTAQSQIENNANLSREQKDQLKSIASARIENIAKKAKENNADSGMQLSEFMKELEDGTNILGDFGKKLLDSDKALSSFKEVALDKFAKALNEASKAAKEAQIAFRKAREITNEGNMNLREVLKGYGETYDEKRNRIMGEVSSLAGGETTVQGIKNRQIQLAAQREAIQSQQDTLTDRDALRKNVEQLNKLDNQLRDNKEALDMLANSTELVDKAFSDLQNTAELQNNRQNFVNQLLTNTPEEADKLNQSFIRLQRNLSGGLNSPYNQRDARKAFNEALFKTGNVREATRAGNTVLANQRKETLALMQDPGFRAAQELQIRNQYAMGQGKPGVSADQAIAEYFKNQQLQVTKQMAIESGMINNPLVQQSLAALENREADPAMKQAAERYLEAVGLRADATKAQGELSLLESQLALKNANDNLRISIDDLRATIEGNMNAAGMGTDAAGNRIVNPGVVVGAPPVARSSGGLVYASKGRLIDFKSKGTDTIPAMLSPGEFVVNSEATQNNLPLLKSINAGYFAQGGLTKSKSKQQRQQEELDLINEGYEIRTRPLGAYTNKYKQYEGVYTDRTRKAPNPLTDPSYGFLDRTEQQDLARIIKQQKEGTYKPNVYDMQLLQDLKQRASLQSGSSWAKENVPNMTAGEHGQMLSYISGLESKIKSYNMDPKKSGRFSSIPDSEKTPKTWEGYVNLVPKLNRADPDEPQQSFHGPYVPSKDKADAQSRNSRDAGISTGITVNGKSGPVDILPGPLVSDYHFMSEKERDQLSRIMKGQEDGSYQPTNEDIKFINSMRERVRSLVKKDYDPRAGFGRSTSDTDPYWGKYNAGETGSASNFFDALEKQTRNYYDDQRYDPSKHQRDTDIVGRGFQTEGKFGTIKNRPGPLGLAIMTKKEQERVARIIREQEAGTYQPNEEDRAFASKLNQKAQSYRNPRTMEQYTAGDYGKGINFFEKFESQIKSYGKKTKKEEDKKTKSPSTKKSQEDMSPADIARGQLAYARQQQYLSRFRPEVREQKEKDLLAKGQLYYPDGSSPRGKVFTVEGSRSTQNEAPLILPPGYTGYKQVPDVTSKDGEILLPDSSGGMLNSSSGELAKTQTAPPPQPAAKNEAQVRAAESVLDKELNELTDEDIGILQQRASDPRDRGMLKALSRLRSAHTLGIGRFGRPDQSEQQAQENARIMAIEEEKKKTEARIAERNQRAKDYEAKKAALKVRENTIREYFKDYPDGKRRADKVIADLPLWDKTTAGRAADYNTKFDADIIQMGLFRGKALTNWDRSDLISPDEAIYRYEAQLKRREDYMRGRAAGDFDKFDPSESPAVQGIMGWLTGKDKGEPTKIKGARVMSGPIKPDVQSIGVAPTAQSIKIDPVTFRPLNYSKSDIAKLNSEVKDLETQLGFKSKDEYTKKLLEKKKGTLNAIQQAATQAMEVRVALNSQTESRYQELKKQADGGKIPSSLKKEYIKLSLQRGVPYGQIRAFAGNISSVEDDMRRGVFSDAEMKQWSRQQRKEFEVELAKEKETSFYDKVASELSDIARKNVDDSVTSLTGNKQLGQAAGLTAGFGTGVLTGIGNPSTTAVGVSTAGMGYLSSVGLQAAAGTTAAGMQYGAGQNEAAVQTLKDTATMAAINLGLRILTDPRSAKLLEQAKKEFAEGISNPPSLTEFLNDPEMREIGKAIGYTDLLETMRTGQVVETTSMFPNATAAVKKVGEAIERMPTSGAMRGTEFGTGGGNAATLNARAAGSAVSQGSTYTTSQPRTMTYSTAGSTPSSMSLTDIIPPEKLAAGVVNAPRIVPLSAAEEKAIAQNIQKLVQETPTSVSGNLKYRGVRGVYKPTGPKNVTGNIQLADASDAFALSHEQYHAASRALGVLENEGLLTQNILDNLPKEYSAVAEGAGLRVKTLDDYIAARALAQQTGKAIPKEIALNAQLARVEEEAAVSAALGEKPTDNPSYNKELKKYNKSVKNKPEATPPTLKSQTSPKPAQKKANGGLIYAQQGDLIDFAPRGTDTVPAMLTPGEFVVNAQSTKQNLPLLHAINKNKGGKINYLEKGGQPHPYQLRGQRSIVPKSVEPIKPLTASEMDMFEKSKPASTTTDFLASQMEYAKGEAEANAIMSTMDLRTVNERLGADAAAFGLGAAEGGAQLGAASVATYGTAALMGLTPAAPLAPIVAPIVGGVVGALTKYGIDKTYEATGTKDTTDAIKAASPGANFAGNMLPAAGLIASQGAAAFAGTMSDRIAAGSVNAISDVAAKGLMGEDITLKDAAISFGIGAAIGSKGAADDLAGAFQAGRRGVGQVIGGEYGRSLQLTEADAARAAANIEAQFADLSGDKTAIYTGTAGDWHLQPGAKTRASGNLGMTEFIPDTSNESVKQFAQYTADLDPTRGGAAGHGGKAGYFDTKPELPIDYARKGFIQGKGAPSVLVAEMPSTMVQNAPNMFDPNAPLTQSMQNELLAGQSPTIYGNIPGRSAPSDIATPADVVNTYVEKNLGPDVAFSDESARAAQKAIVEQTLMAALPRVRSISHGQIDPALAGIPGTALAVNPEVLGQHTSTDLFEASKIQQSSPDFKSAALSEIGMDNNKEKSKPKKYNFGGIVYANNGALTKASGQIDSIPAMLTPGEFVINKDSAKKHLPVLQAINSGHFSRGGIVNYLASGGIAMPHYYATGGLTYRAKKIEEDNRLREQMASLPAASVAQASVPLGQESAPRPVSNAAVPLEPAALAPVANATQAVKQSASSTGGVSNNIGIDTASISSSIQDAVTTAIGQFNEYTEQIGANFTEQFNAAQKSLSSSINTFQTATAQFGEHANAIPTSLSANVTQTTSLHHIGLDSIKGNMEKSIYENTSTNAKNISQSTFEKYDKAVWEGGMNSASKQGIIGSKK